MDCFPFSECLNCLNLDCDRNVLYCQMCVQTYSKILEDICPFYHADSVELVATTNSNQNK